MPLDPVRFNEFKEKRDAWIECMDGKDQHSIVHQITHMIWDAAAFRMVNEARKIAPAAVEGGVQLNGMMHTLIDKCFFTSQMVAIRRLRDTYTLSGKKGVYSISALLADMKANVHLITREHIFAAEGLAYDYEEIRQKHIEYTCRTMRRGKASFIPRELDWHRNERRHQDLDRLCSTTTESRSLVDTVRSEVLSHLETKLTQACDDIAAHVDKFVAHAATPASRATANADAAKVTLGHLWEAHRTICEIANFIDVNLLTGTHHGFLAVPQYDQFAYIERPLISSDHLKQLRDAWDEFSDEKDRWGNYGLDELEAELTGSGNGVTT